MRSMGQGYHGIKKMTALMDMPHSMTTNNYDKIVNNITTVVKSDLKLLKLIANSPWVNTSDVVITSI